MYFLTEMFSLHFIKIRNYDKKFNKIFFKSKLLQIIYFRYLDVQGVQDGYLYPG